MSMVLEALKRSRSESQTNSAVPSVDANHYLEPAHRGVPLWVSITGIVLVGVIAVLLTLLFKSSMGTSADDVSRPSSELESAGDVASALDNPPDLSAPTSVDSVVASVADSVADSVMDSAANGAVNGTPNTAVPVAKAKPDPSVAALYQRSKAQQTSPIGPDSAPNASQAMSQYQSAGRLTRQSSDPEINAKASVPTSIDTTDALADRALELNSETPIPRQGISETPIEEENIDLENLLRQAQAELGESPLLPHPTPLLEQLSQQQKDKVPTVLYTLHDYNARGQSVVVLNGQRLSVGQRAMGFTVKEILADSVIVSWGGIDFRLRALNSWVNL